MTDTIYVARLVNEAYHYRLRAAPVEQYHCKHIQVAHKILVNIVWYEWVKACASLPIDDADRLARHKARLASMKLGDYSDNGYGACGDFYERFNLKATRFALPLRAWVEETDLIT